MEMIRAREIPNGVVNVSNLSANNLLHKFFISSTHFCNRDNESGENREEVKKLVVEEEEEKHVELSLGLSLNGQFGTDPRSRKNKNFELGRSSSIPEGFVFAEQRYGGGDLRRMVEPRVSSNFQLDRTRSLPVEVERKRRRSDETRAFMEFPIHSLTTDENRVQAAEMEKARERFVVNERGKNVNSAKKSKKNVQVSGMEKARNILEDMPCVSTRDVGADGKRVEGFLYWYGGNKEEVKIVCVCHGSFLSPAEFVEHGGVTNSNGGADVTTNPLRHIVVKIPSSSSSSRVRRILTIRDY